MKNRGNVDVMRDVNRMLGVISEPQPEKVAQFTTENHGNLSKSVTASSDIGFQLPTPLIPQVSANGPQVSANGPQVSANGPFPSTSSALPSFSFSQVCVYILCIAIHRYVHIFICKNMYTYMFI
jgi:hypothetical protein